MASAYLIVKFFHVLLAIVAVGSNITYGAWFARANAQPEFAPFALRGIKFIDDHIANPAYILLLPTGALMVWLGGYGFGTRWIAAAMTLWAIAIVLAYAAYTPTLTRQIAAVERDGVASESVRQLSVRGQIWAAVIGVLVVAILILMIFKPT